MSHSSKSMLFIDGVDRLVKFLDKRMQCEVRKDQAAADRARERGDDESARRLKAAWLAKDEMHGRALCWMEAFVAEHRASVVTALINGWPKQTDWDDIEAGNDDGELDFLDDGEDLAEAAD